MKTLVTILHYNTIDLTDSLYESLLEGKDNSYDIMVLDNGSDSDKVSKYTTHQLEENIFFGGGLNIAFDYMLQNQEYDSMMFMNSDLIIHGKNFVKTLHKELIENDLKIISPCILEVSKQQTYWKPMRPWNTNMTRLVPWIDFQCPMFHRSFIEEVKQFDQKLMYGWGQDVLSGLICEDKGWKIGVSDITPCIHLVSQTIKANSDKPKISQYNILAEKNMFEYFSSVNIIDKILQLRNKSSNYDFSNHTSY
jgi:hypothetical protein